MGEKEASVRVGLAKPRLRGLWWMFTTRQKAFSRWWILKTSVRDQKKEKEYDKTLWSAGS